MSQYGIDGGIMAGTAAIRWTQEKREMRRIEEKQDQIFISNTTIATEQTRIKQLNLKLYKALSTADGLLTEAETLVRIYDRGQEIYEWQSLSLELIKDQPDLSDQYLPIETRIILEMAYLVDDLVIATKEGENNLMNSSERFLLMGEIHSKMRDISKASAKLYRMLNGLKATKILDRLDLVVFDTEENNRRILEEAKNDYRTIFKD